MISVFTKGVQTASKQSRRALSLCSNEVKSLGVTPASQTALLARLISTSSSLNQYATRSKTEARRRYGKVATEGALQCAPAVSSSLNEQQVTKNKTVKPASVSGSTFSMLQPPFFEGSEKRVEIQYIAANPRFGDTRGLRQVPRSAWAQALSRAGITIESAIYGDHWDCYMLSESSLFVSRTRIICKTCGQSAPLEILEDALRFGTELGYEPKLVLFSRSDLLRPDEQLPVHQSFDAECTFLNQALPHAVSTNAYTLGDAGRAQWNLYQAVLPTTISEIDAGAELVPPTLEIVCYGLDPANASVWWSDRHSTPDGARFASGLSATMPNDGIVDEMLFSPCGYSMNCFDQAGVHSTVHVTPQEGCSFASFESTILDLSTVNDIIQNLVYIFKPERFSVSLLEWSMHDQPVTSEHPTDDIICASQYAMDSTTSQRLTHGRLVGHHRFSSFELNKMHRPLICTPQPYLMGGKRENSMWRSSIHMQREQRLIQKDVKFHSLDPFSNDVPYNGSLFWYTDHFDDALGEGGEVLPFHVGEKQESSKFLSCTQHAHVFAEQDPKYDAGDPISNHVPYNGSLFWYTDPADDLGSDVASGQTSKVEPYLSGGKQGMEHARRLVQQELKQHVEGSSFSNVPYNGSLFWYSDPLTDTHQDPIAETAPHLIVGEGQHAKMSSIIQQ
jgi:S-adenosylmethionine decarboxylase